MSKSNDILSKSYTIKDFEFEPIPLGSMTLRQAGAVEKLIQQILPLFDQGINISEMLKLALSEGKLAARIVANILVEKGHTWTVQQENQLVGPIEEYLTIDQIREIITDFFAPAAEFTMSFLVSSPVVEKLLDIGGKLSQTPPETSSPTPSALPQQNTGGSETAPTE